MGIDNIPSSMLACQIVEFKKPYQIRSVPTPKSLEAHDLLVKVTVASFCHTDGMVAAGVFGGSLPRIASHEGSGIVAAVGSGVTDFRLGDRVMCGLPIHRCGECLNCKMPEEYRQYCQKVKGNLGVTVDGAFAEYVLCDAREACLLPDKVSFEKAAPLACAGCTVYRGVLQAKLQKGQWLGLVGSGGGLGHLGIQFAKAKGLKVVGIDARDEGLELSKKMGADVVVDARREKKEVIKEVMEITGGNGCAATVNVSDAKTAAALACAITVMHGRMIQIAQPAEVAVPFPELIFRDVRIEGSLICSRRQAQEMLELVAEHDISVKTNAFHGLDRIPELLELAHSGRMKGKGIIVVDDRAMQEEKKLGARTDSRI